MTRECIIYARVSSDRQEKEGFSIPAQLESMRAYATKRGFTIVGEYTEVQTAAKIGRTQFSQIMKGLRKKGAAKIVIVEKTDRLTRNFHDVIDVDNLISDFGVEFHLVRSNRTLGPSMSPEEKFHWRNEVNIAEFYVNNLSREAKKGIRQKRRQGGWCGHAPYGYQMIEGALFPFEPNATFVKRAFQLYASGTFSLKALSRRLYSEGLFYLPSSPIARAQKLHDILTNSIYISECLYEDSLVKMVHEPLVDLFTWNSAQAALTQSSKPLKAGKTFVYSGIAKCGECGSTIVGELKKRRYVYYRCVSYANQLGCSQKYISEKMLDAYTKTVLQSIIFPPDYKARLLEIVNRSERLKENTEAEEMERIQLEMGRAKTRYKRVYNLYIDGKLDDEMWAEEQRDHQKKMHTLQDAFNKLSSTDVPYRDLLASLFELPEMMMDTWSSQNPAKKAQIVKLLYSNFSVRDKKPAGTLATPWSLLVQCDDLGKKLAEDDVLRTFILTHSQLIKTVYKDMVA